MLPFQPLTPGCHQDGSTDSANMDQENLSEDNVDHFRGAGLPSKDDNCQSGDATDPLRGTTSRHPHYQRHRRERPDPANRSGRPDHTLRTTIRPPCNPNWSSRANYIEGGGVV